MDLEQKGIIQWNYPWDSRKIYGQIKNNHSFVLSVNKKIIGTFCINGIEKINGLRVEPESKYLFQIAILPKYQGRKIGRKIIDFACSLVKDLNKDLYLDCWAGNKKLKKFYSDSGLDIIGDFPEEDYFISVFRTNKL